MQDHVDDQVAGEGRNGATAEGDLRLASELGRLARDLAGQADLEATLSAIVTAAVGTIPGAAHASISTVTRRSRLTTRAASDDIAIRVDVAQYELGEGPCLDALFEHRTVLAPDLADEPRWPRFGRHLGELGVRGMLAVRLYVRGDDLGALNLSSTDVGAFDESSAQVAALFAAHASVALDGAQKERQLRDALSHRDVIGQAMGIVMERFGLTSDRAFGVLVRLSQHLNRKLFDVATEIVTTRSVPASAEEPVDDAPRSARRLSGTS